MSSVPAPYAEADDAALVDACIAGDGDAWRALGERYGRLMQAVVVRVVDERRSGTLEEVPGCMDEVIHHLKRQDATALRAWKAACSLRVYLAVVSRQVAQNYLQDVTPMATMVASMPTPAAIFLDETAAELNAQKVTEALDRLSPNLSALVRLRLRALDRSAMAATLGLPPATVVQNLEYVAQRLAEILDASDDAVQAWRMVLDAASLTERVSLAVRTGSDESFRQVRSLTEGTWRAVRDRALTRLHPKQDACLDDRVIASFVDGSLKGSDRAKAQGHVSVCPRCIDSVATVVGDMRTVEALRDAAALSDEVALSAACVATSRFRAGRLLGEFAVGQGEARGRLLVRLAQLGGSLIGEPLVDEPSAPIEPSRVVARHTPSDEEAPLVALEALANDDARTAARVVDDEVARSALGTRLRLLAAVCGDDPPAGRTLAAELLAKSHSDPGLLGDAEVAMALPEGSAMPHEVLVSRIRDMIPAAVRLVLTA